MSFSGCSCPVTLFEVKQFSVHGLMLYRVDLHVFLGNEVTKPCITHVDFEYLLSPDRMFFEYPDLIASSRVDITWRLKHLG